MSSTEFATRSGTSAWRLLLVTSAWVGVFTGAYAYTLDRYAKDLVHAAPPGQCLLPPTKVPKDVSVALWHSCLTIFLQPSISDIEQLPAEYNTVRESGEYRLFMSAELLIGYVHLGLLVSIMYRKITKHAA